MPDGKIILPYGNYQNRIYIMSDLKALNEKKIELGKALRKMQDQLGKDGRKTFTPEECAAFDKVDMEREEIIAECNTIERIAKVEKEKEAVIERSNYNFPSLPSAKSKTEYEDLNKAFKGWLLTSTRQECKPEYKQAMSRCFSEYQDRNSFYFDQQVMERSDALVATPWGATSIQEALIARFDLAKKSIGGLRSACDVITSASGNKLPFMYIDDTGVNAAAKTKGADIVHTDMNVTRVDVDCATIATGLYPIPRELIQDSGTDILGRAGDALAQRIYRKQNVDCTTGTTGVVTSAESGKVLASTSAITYAELVDAQHSVDFAYNTPGRRGWMFHQQTLAYLKKMVDGQSRPLWQVSMAGGTPDTLLDEPYWINNDMVQLGAINRKIMVYGDFNYFVINEVKGIEVQAMLELYAKQYAVGLHGVLRYGCNYVMPNTIKYVITAAS